MLFILTLQTLDPHILMFHFSADLFSSHWNYFDISDNLLMLKHYYTLRLHISIEEHVYRFLFLLRHNMPMQRTENAKFYLRYITNKNTTFRQTHLDIIEGKYNTKKKNDGKTVRLSWENAKEMKKKPTWTSDMKYTYYMYWSILLGWTEKNLAGILALSSLQTAYTLTFFENVRHSKF